MTGPGTGTPWLELDSERILEATAALPDHLRGALAAETSAEIAPGARLVAVLGMGGSGVAGAALQAYAATRSPLPVVLVRGYDVPVFVGPDALVFAVSFSGETEETLEAAESCIKRGARVVGVTSGGSLASLVSAAGGHVLSIPQGIPAARAGIAAMTAPMLLACEHAGLLQGAARDIERAAEQLERRLPPLVAGGGEAKEIARRIGRTVPLVHGGDGLGAVAAARWKTQVNENAKAPAFHGSQPEVCHNEVCGFGQHGDVTRQLLTLVQLEIPGEHCGIARRLGLFAEIVAEAVGDVVRVTAAGEGDLAGFFDLVAIGDVVSLHLAAREGVDPGPVPVLGEIKRRVREP